MVKVHYLTGHDPKWAGQRRESPLFTLKNGLGIVHGATRAGTLRSTHGSRIADAPYPP
jgi:hypothetical protein